jgi:hypothetical protein
MDADCPNSVWPLIVCNFVVAGICFIFGWNDFGTARMPESAWNVFGATCMSVALGLSIGIITSKYALRQDAYTAARIDDAFRNRRVIRNIITEFAGWQSNPLVRGA